MDGMVLTIIVIAVALLAAVALWGGLTKPPPK